jgi:hypothetical protein
LPDRCDSQSTPAAPPEVRKSASVKDHLSYKTGFTKVLLFRQKKEAAGKATSYFGNQYIKRWLSG